MRFRFEFNQYANLFKIFKFIQDYSITKCSKIIQDYYKPLHYLSICLVAYFNWVVLESPWGTCFWLRTKLACPPTPPQTGLIIHWHLQIFFLRNHHIRFRVMCQAILLSSSHHPRLTEPDSDSETYLHREIGDQTLN